MHITVQRALGSRVPAQVLDYGADFGVVTFRPETAALNSIVVYHDELAFVVPPSHPLAGRAKVAMTELGSESFVAHHVSSPYRQKVIDTFRKRRVELRMPVEMPTIDAIKKFVAMGNGVALLPAITVERELAHKELVRVEVPELAFDRQLRLIHRREGALSHAAEAMLTVVEAQSALKGGRFAFAPER